MRLDQGQDHEELRLRLQQESRAPESVTRNVHGQSLEDARTAFREEWEAKIAQKREQAEQARRRQLWWGAATWKIFRGGAGVGLFLGMMAGTITPAVTVPAMPPFLTAIILWTILASPFVFFASACEWRWKKRAERLDRELRELERA